MFVVVEKEELELNKLRIKTLRTLFSLQKHKTDIVEAKLKLKDRVDNNEIDLERFNSLSVRLDEFYNSVINEIDRATALYNRALGVI